VLAWTLLIVPLVVVALLSVPVDLSFRIRRDDSKQTRVVLRWMFGLVRFPVMPRKAEPASTPRRRKRGWPFSARRLDLLRQGAFLRRLSWLLQRSVTEIRVREFSLRLRLGFDDPAETGFLWALLGPLTVLLNGRFNAVLDVAPEFRREMLEVDAEGEIRVVPARLAWLALMFALSPAVLRVIWRQVGRA
jgi:hypothetical protein